MIWIFALLFGLETPGFEQAIFPQYKASRLGPPTIYLKSDDPEVYNRIYLGGVS